MPKSSKYIGVSRHNLSKDKFIAQLKCNGKNDYLGIYSQEEDAARAYYRRAVNLLRQGVPCHPEKLIVRVKWYKDNYPQLTDESPPISASNDVASENEPRRYRGITWYSAREVWKASVHYKKHKYFAGTHKSRPQAVKAYNAKIDDLYRQFNDPVLLRKKHPAPPVSLDEDLNIDDFLAEPFPDLDWREFGATYTPLHDALNSLTPIDPSSPLSFPSWPSSPQLTL